MWKLDFSCSFYILVAVLGRHGAKYILGRNGESVGTEERVLGFYSLLLFVSTLVVLVID